MASLADYERDYWAEDRDQVLAQMRAEQGFAGGNSGIAGGGAPTMTTPGWSVGGGGWTQPGWAGSDWQPPGYGAGTGGNWWGGGGGGNPVDWSAIEQQWTGGGGKTLNDWQQFVQKNPQIQPYVTGSKGDKLKLPDGTVIDAVYASGLGGQGAQWIREGSGSASGGGGDFNFPQFSRPGEFSYAGWQMPTGLTEENDPGFQARLAEGQKALERSAAARGTLLTGGTMKDLNRFAQDYASNEFANVVNRSLQDYQTNRGNAFQNYQTNFQNALDAYKTNFQTAFQPWEANWQHKMGADQQRYGQLYGLANLGLQATGQQANAYGNYGNQLANMYGNYGNAMGDLFTGKGNAAASGTVGSSNAWGGAFGNMANMAQLYGMYGMMNQQPKTTKNPGYDYSAGYYGQPENPWV